MTVGVQYYRDPGSGDWLPIEPTEHTHPDAGAVGHDGLSGLDDDDHKQYARLVQDPGPTPRAGFLRYSVVGADEAALDVWDEGLGQYLGVGGPMGPTGPAGPQGVPGLNMTQPEADARYVNVTGDAMTGALAIASDAVPLTVDRTGPSETAIVMADDGTPRVQLRALATGGLRLTDGAGAATYARLTPAGVELPSEPTVDTHAATKRYVDRASKSIGLLGPNASYWRTTHDGTAVVAPTAGKSESTVAWPAGSGRYVRISPSIASTASPGTVRVSLTVTADTAATVVGTIVSQPDPLGPSADLGAAGVVATNWTGGAVGAGATQRLTFDMEVPADACTFRAFVSVEVAGTAAAQVVVRHLAMTWSAASGGSLGEIKMFAAAALVPPDWLVLDGSAIPAQYADLIAAIGPTLPNWDSRVPMGGGTPLTLGGANSRTLALANLPSHAHTIVHDHPSTTSSSDSHSHSIAVKTGDNIGRDVHPHDNNATQIAVAGGTQGTNTTRSTASDAHTHTVDLANYSGNSGSAGSGTALDTTPAHVRAVFAIYAGA